MAKKKVRSAVKDDAPSVEEVFKTFGISGDPIKGHSKKVGQPVNGGTKDAGPSKVSSPLHDAAASADTHAASDSEELLEEARFKKPKDPSRVRTVRNRENPEEVKRASLPTAQEASASNVIASPSFSQTLGECDTPSASPPTKEARSGPSPDIATKEESVPVAKAPWVDLFKENRNPSKGLALQFMEDLPDIPALKLEHAMDVHTVWGYSLVGYFAGRFPGKSALLKLCDSWHVKYKYSAHSSGWLIFQFDNEASRDSVLAGGPYTVFGRPLMLKAMPPFFEFDDHNVSILPVWINLPALPLECWTQAALSIICSKVGKPISTDSITATRGQFSYARVLVEIDAAKELVKFVSFKLPSGKVRTQPVLYEFEPKFCAHCKAFGHSTKGCKAFETEQALTKPAEGNASANKQGDGPSKAPAGTKVAPNPTPIPQDVSKETGPFEQPVPNESTQAKGHSASPDKAIVSCPGPLNVQPVLNNIETDTQALQEGMPPKQTQEDPSVNVEQPEAPFITVTPRKKRLIKPILCEEGQVVDDQIPTRKPKQKGVQADAKKGASIPQRVIKKGLSPPRSR